MTEQPDNMNLAELYRHLCESSAAPSLDADTLAAFAAGRLNAEQRDAVLRVLAVSPQQADLARLLVDLTPASETLAAAAAQRSQGHVRHGSTSTRRLRGVAQPAAPRHVPRARRATGLRWFAAAAVLVAVAGLWGWQHAEAPGGGATVATAPATPASADTIFSSSMGHAVAVQNAKADHHRDEIFSAGFHARKSG